MVATASDGGGGSIRAVLHYPLAQAGLAQPRGGTVVQSYTLGPISAGSDSPLGGFFGFIAGLSTNYAAGLNAFVNAPRQSGLILGGETLSPDDLTAIKEAERKGLSSSPSTQVGQIAGSWLGLGVGQIGRTVGVAGGQAALGVSQGVQQGVGGVATVGAAGVSGGFAGAIQGLGSGLSTTLGANAMDPSLIFVGIVVLVIILASK